MSDDLNVAQPNLKDVIGQKLQDRDNERLKELNKRRDHVTQSSSKSESTAFFLETLTAEVASLRCSLAAANSKPKAELPAYFDQLSSKLAEIQKYVTDSAFFISSRDLERTQLQLKDLQNELMSCRDSLLPKKKFAFKSRKKPLLSSTDAAQTQDAMSAGNSKNGSVGMKGDNHGDASNNVAAVPETAVALNEYSINGVADQDVMVNVDEVNGKDVIISSTSRSTLKIAGIPAAMQLTDIKDCTILCGPCARSIFIERCSNCVLVLACQQLRVHEAVDCDFFIHVTSKAIIEDSTKLRFGPYQLAYDGITDHYTQSGLSCDINNWSDVDDFNWLVKDKQSPNWSLLPEDKRITHKI